MGRASAEGKFSECRSAGAGVARGETKTKNSCEVCCKVPVGVVDEDRGKGRSVNGITTAGESGTNSRRREAMPSWVRSGRVYSEVLSAWGPPQPG